MNRSNSISVDSSSINLIENTLKSDNLNLDSTEASITNTNNQESSVLEEAK